MTLNLRNYSNTLISTEISAKYRLKHGLPPAQKKQFIHNNNNLNNPSMGYSSRSNHDILKSRKIATDFLSCCDIEINIYRQ